MMNPLNIFDVFKGGIRNPAVGFLWVLKQRQKVRADILKPDGKKMNNALAQTKACKKNFSVLTLFFSSEVS